MGRGFGGRKTVEGRNQRKGGGFAEAENNRRENQKRGFGKEGRRGKGDEEGDQGSGVGVW